MRGNAAWTWLRRPSVDIRSVSIPAQADLFKARDLVGAPPAGSPGAEPRKAPADIIDLTAYATPLARRPSPHLDANDLAAGIIKDAIRNPARMLATQHTPSAGRVQALLAGQ